MSELIDLPSTPELAAEGRFIRKITGFEKDSEEVTIEFMDGGSLKLHHSQDCCESVDIADLDGSPEDVVGHYITQFREESSDAEGDENVSESGTWTFYHVDTSGGSLWMRWLGESNGYYSEAVDAEVQYTDRVVRVEGGTVVLYAVSEVNKTLKYVAHRPFNPAEIHELTAWVNMALEVTKH